MDFKKIRFPSTYQYSSDSDHIPLEFYEETFPLAKTIDLLLGYFSSSAIKVLSMSLAEFIYNGGKLRLITNHFFSKEDYDNLILKKEFDHDIINIFGDIEELERNLSKEGKHFFDCLLYLKSENRLEIKPVKFQGNSMSHSKVMILHDGSETICTSGSINFTLSAILKNSEHFQVEVPWNGDVAVKRIDENVKKFDEIFKGIHKDYRHLDSNELIKVIDTIGKPKELKELLDDSMLIEIENQNNKVSKIKNRRRERFDEFIKEESSKPKFPNNESPRDYQIQAYNRWITNDYKGVFAMATGTGKTKTSLNCLVEEFKKTKTYFVIVLVPSISLLDQWTEEVEEFNFTKILKVGGGNPWEQFLPNYASNFKAGLKNNLFIISTYNSFCSDRFQKYFKNIESEFTLIADEAHNIGANNIKAVLKDCIVSKRIGLSATPKRIYDLEGTQFIDEFFNDQEPYIFNFNMKEAMERGYLTPYYYYPLIVQLKDNEFDEYIEISKKLLKYFDFENGLFKNDPIVEILLLKRKSIIHKAENKLKTFQDILLELKGKNKLEYIFTYVPEGIRYKNEGGESRIIDEYLVSAHTNITFITHEYLYFGK